MVRSRAAGRTADEGGAFKTVNFEVRGSSVIWSGQVLREGLKEKAEHAVREVKGVGKVVNKIEVLPPSRQDDVLRVNMYRAIYKASRGRRRPETIRRYTSL